ncbi:MAG: type II toxin-antitoxin system prevent-host-death family antitoxin [Acidimicrobiia bacterium]|nr:type II toxin-antitoxin system prevent-host-death family antitoxin [Acidimicrobiia bacterium]
MVEVTVRELRNHGGEVLDRVIAGERLTVTRDGRPVAELRPLPRSAAAAGDLLRRWSHLPHVDPAAVRADIDRVLDPSL